MPVAHIGAGSGLGLDEPASRSSRYTVATVIVRDAGALGQFPHGRQPHPGRQFAQRDAELDQTAQLHAERHRQ